MKKIITNKFKFFLSFSSSLFNVLLKRNKKNISLKTNIIVPELTPKINKVLFSSKLPSVPPNWSQKYLIVGAETINIKAKKTRTSWNTIKEYQGLDFPSFLKKNRPIIPAIKPVKGKVKKGNNWKVQWWIKKTFVGSQIAPNIIPSRGPKIKPTVIIVISLIEIGMNVAIPTVHGWIKTVRSSWTIKIA